MQRISSPSFVHEKSKMHDVQHIAEEDDESLDASKSDKTSILTPKTAKGIKIISPNSPNKNLIGSSKKRKKSSSSSGNLLIQKLRSKSDQSQISQVINKSSSSSSLGMFSVQGNTANKEYHHRLNFNSRKDSIKNEGNSLWDAEF